MAMSAIWIRHNMLGTVEQQERKLTDAELRVQRSLEKLSIPDWYLNKHSNPPKILRNDTPIECRPPSWKNPGLKRPSGIDTTCKQFAEYCAVSESNGNNADDNTNNNTNNNNVVDTGTYKVSRQIKLVMANRAPRRSPSRVRRIQKEEIMNTDIPKLKLPTHVSKTFPKVSPSRKIQNINIVFPPGPPLDISNSSVQDSESVDTKYQTFVVKKPISECNNQSKEEKDDDQENDDDSCSTPTKSYANYSFRTFSPDSCDVSLRTGNMECSFTVRAVSTPKQASVSLFSSAIFEEIPRMKRLPNEIVAEKTFIKDSPKKSAPADCPEQTITDEAPRSKKKLLPSPRQDSQDVSTPRKISSAHMILANKFRSLEPIIFEKNNSKYPPSPRKSYVAVREIAKKFDHQSKSRKSPELEKKLDVQSASPCTRFFYSKKKSTELENIVQNTQSTRGNGVVRGIIEELSEKSKTWTLRENRVKLSNQNYVKEVVSALEKGDTLKAKKVVLDRSRSMLEEDIESYSESDGKSVAFSTSISLKDTDSSDSDQRTPTLKSDEESQFDYSTLASRQTLVESLGKSCQTDEEDSVYWIPVTRYQLPRTSSLLSVISRLPTNGYQSPCVSPIKSDSDSSECANPVTWNATYKKNTITKKLFRIDETTVTDSGYSDRSVNRNVSKSSMADDTWSEETQHDDSGSDSRDNRLKKSSSRRKTMVGLKSVLV